MAHKISTIIVRTIVLITFLYNRTNTIDNAHFYRANYMWQEPRLPNEWLASVDISIAGGSTHTGRNTLQQKTNILGIYGPQSLSTLGLNVPNLDPTHPLDALLIALAALPTNGNFGKVALTGTFSIAESTLNVYQNLINGFFLQAYLPVRYLKIANIQYTDLSPDSGTPNSTTPEWQDFLLNMNAIFNRYGLEPLTTSGRSAGAGDFSILGGWAGNYLGTCHLDFIDVSAKFGGLFPTGRTRSLDNPFELPLGYNGHYGVPLKFDASIGLYEWITTGIHIGALFLFESKQTLRMKTAAEQNGFIDLLVGKASIDPGTLWDFAAYATADHFFKGLSLSVGYSFNKKDHDCITPEDLTLFPSNVVNQDPLYKGWDMHDFAKEYCDIGPRIGFFYNYVVQGRRIFNTGMIQSYAGIDIAYVY